MGSVLKEQVAVLLCNWRHGECAPWAPAAPHVPTCSQESDGLWLGSPTNSRVQWKFIYGRF
jgi:hypothetical protein